VGIKKRANKKA